MRKAKPGFTAWEKMLDDVIQEAGNKENRWKETDFERQNMNAEELG